MPLALCLESDDAFPTALLVGEIFVDRAHALAAGTPRQLRIRREHRIQPGKLAGRVAVVPLLHAARPPSERVRRHPSTCARRFSEKVRSPRVGRLRVLQHTAAPPHRRQCTPKTPAVIPQEFARLVSCFAGIRAWTSVPITAPPFTGRVRHAGKRSGVQPRVPGHVPRVHVRQSEVDPAWVDKECRHRRGGRHGSVPVITDSETGPMGKTPLGRPAGGCPSTAEKPETSHRAPHPKTERAFSSPSAAGAFPQTVPR